MSGLLTLPLALARGTIALAEQLPQEAMREFYDPQRMELGIDWWTRHPMLSGSAEHGRLADENQQLRQRVEELEAERE